MSNRNYHRPWEPSCPTMRGRSWARRPFSSRLPSTSTLWSRRRRDFCLRTASSRGCSARPSTWSSRTRRTRHRRRKGGWLTQARTYCEELLRPGLTNDWCFFRSKVVVRGRGGRRVGGHAEQAGARKTNEDGIRGTSQVGKWTIEEERLVILLFCAFPGSWRISYINFDQSKLFSAIQQKTGWVN